MKKRHSEKRPGREHKEPDGARAQKRKFEKGFSADDKAASAEELPGYGNHQHRESVANAATDTITDGRENRILQAENFGPS